jgi:hypothetical protein
MTRTGLRSLEGRQVNIALRDGGRIDDCQLVSAGRASTATVWVFSNGTDLFLEFEELADAWESAVRSRAA